MNSNLCSAHNCLILLLLLSILLLIQLIVKSTLSTSSRLLTVNVRCQCLLLQIQHIFMRLIDILKVVFVTCDHTANTFTVLSLSVKELSPVTVLCLGRQGCAEALTLRDIIMVKGTSFRFMDISFTLHYQTYHN